MALSEKFGSEYRAYFSVLPAIANDYIHSLLKREHGIDIVAVNNLQKVFTGFAGRTAASVTATKEL